MRRGRLAVSFLLLVSLAVYGTEATTWSGSKQANLSAMAAVQVLWGNQTLHGEASNCLGEWQQAACQSFANFHDAARATSTPAEQASALVISQLGLRNSAVVHDLQDFTKRCSMKQVAFVQQATSQKPFVYNSAVVACSGGQATVWWQAVAVDLQTASLSGDAERMIFVDVGSRSWASASGSSEKAMDIYLLLTVLSVGRALHVLPHSLERSTKENVGSFVAAMAAFDQGVKSAVDALKALASAFGTHTTTKIIGEDSCMGFDKFSENTTVNVIQCLPDEQVETFVNNYFDDLAWAFGGDMSKVRGELLIWEYAQGNNFSHDSMQLTNTADSTVKMMQVFKNHDDKQACSHWVIVEFAGVFQFAPDLIYWEKSTSSWFGAETKDTVYTQQVPHKISPQDVEALTILFKILAYGKLADTRGIKYTWPKLPTCGNESSSKRSEVAHLSDVVWSWATTAWSNCSKPCGGGTSTRSVFCVSSGGETDPTGAKCSGTKPATSQACNEVPCTGQYLVQTLKNATDREMAALPSEPPKGSSAVVQNLKPAGGHDVVSVPPGEVKTVQSSWQVTNGWPVNVTNSFEAIAYGAQSEQYQAFAFAYSPAQGAWAVVLGAARNFNGTVDMAYVFASSTGAPITQHYGDDKTVQCPDQQSTQYTMPGCEAQPSDCGSYGHECPSGGMCPQNCACIPCQCTVSVPSSPHTVSVSGKFTCTQLLGSGALQVRQSGMYTPGTCQNRGNPMEKWCMFNSPTTGQTFDFGSCRDQGHLEQCNKPLDASQIQLLESALEATARAQLPAHMNLLAVMLKQPPPYPSETLFV